MKIKPRNPFARELRSAKYRAKTIPAKRQKELDKEMSGNDFVEVDLLYVHETDNAYLFDMYGPEEERDDGKFWVPKKFCRMEYDASTNKTVIEMAEWKALELGLI
jgi:hypothetical protein